MAGAVNRDQAEARAAFFARAVDFTPLVAVDAERMRYLVSTADEGVGMSLFVRSSRGEMRTFARACGILRQIGIRTALPGGTFVDVGANIGTATITALASGDFARAVACEPVAANTWLLELNLVANGLADRVVICRAAVADCDGRAELVVNERKSGASYVRTADRRPRSHRTEFSVVEVEQVALDSLARSGVLDPDDVGLLWMDAQGHEGHVLRGASLLTDRGVPVVLELSPALLSRSGGLDAVREVASTRYTHFVPLRRARGAGELRFDLEPIDRFDAEIARFERSDFSDFLLLRDPQAAPRRRGRRGQGRVKSAAPAPRKARTERVVHVPTTAERAAFLEDAAELTPLAAVDFASLIFVVRTDDPDDRAFFVERTHSRLDALDEAIAELDRSGDGDAARGRTFVDLGAGSGVATVAALRKHGFRDATAIEPDPAARRVLELNVTANGVADRVRVLSTAAEEATLRAGLVLGTDRPRPATG